MSKGLVLCPIAWVVHCSGCALVKICPAKSVLGDFEQAQPGACGLTEAEEKREKPENESAK